MAKATSSRESSSKTEVPVYSDTLLTDPQHGNIEKRARRASAARHARKCTVCHHKDREFIDQDYLRWLSPKKIAREYAISHQSVVYRHADATGLRAQRRASLRATLENFIEQAESVRATAGSVVAAVRLYAQINDQGQWTPPVRRFIVEHRSAQCPDPSHTKHDPHSSPSARNDPEDTKGEAAPSQERSSKGTPAPAHVPKVSNPADASPAATSDAHSALAPDPSHTKDHPENSHRRSSKGTPTSAPAPRVSNAADASPAATFSAQFAEPLATAHKNSGAIDSTGRLQPVVTITAGSALPFSASPNKFPAVPVATLNLASDLPISNREHMELEHVATR